MIESPDYCNSPIAVKQKDTLGRALPSGKMHVPAPLTFGRLWYGEPNAVSNAIGYAQHYSRSQDAVVRVYDETGNLIGTHEHKGEFKEP